MLVSLITAIVSITMNDDMMFFLMTATMTTLKQNPDRNDLKLGTVVVLDTVSKAC